MTRSPYADEPAVRAEFCTCPRDEGGAIDRGCIETRDELGRLTTRTWYRLTNPACRLHGDDAKPAPF